MREDGTLLAAGRPSGGEPQLSLDFLDARQYANGVAVSRDDEIRAAEDADWSGLSATFERDARYARRIYGRVVVGKDRGPTWLQYWLFFLYSPSGLLSISRHEGDWQTAQIRLGERLVPDLVTCAQGMATESRPWPAVEKATDDPDRPVLYCARGSHALYFASGIHRALDSLYDRADGRRPASHTLEVLDDPVQGWVGWPGRWGRTTRGFSGAGGLRGPAYRLSWEDPDALVERVTTRAPGPVGNDEISAPALAIAEAPDGRIFLQFAASGDRAARSLAVSLVRKADGEVPVTHNFTVAGLTGHVELPWKLEANSSYTVYGSVLDESYYVSPAATLEIRTTNTGALRLSHVGRGAGAMNDQVARSDQLDFNDYVSAFADLIESPDTTPPVTIGILGSQAEEEFRRGETISMDELFARIERKSATKKPAAKRPRRTVARRR